MQYQFTERFQYINTILFKNSLPINNIIKLNYFVEEDITGEFLSKQFRYSFDNVNWSGWRELTQTNLTSITFRNNPYFYLEVLYTRASYISGNIDKFYLFYEGEESEDLIVPTDISINADYLNNEPGSFYLNVENHYGPYYSIAIENLPEPSTFGLYQSRFDSSLGTSFFFKSIKANGKIIIEDNSTFLNIDLDASLASSTIYQNDNPTVATVGGIPAGSSFFNTPKTFSEVMEAIFYPVLYPTFIMPSNTFVMSPSTILYEVSTNITIGFNSTFDRGQILLNNNFQNYRSGSSTYFNYVGYNLPSNVPSLGAPTHSITPFSYDVPIGYTTWEGYVSYDVGPQPYDSKGQPYMTPLSAGNTNVITKTIEGVYPLFATIYDIEYLDKIDTLYSMITGNNMVITLVAQPSSTAYKQSFEIPKVWVDARPLIGIETYDNVFEEWKYYGGNQSTSLLQWVKTVTNETVQGNEIEYYKYSYNGPNRSIVNIRLNF